MPWQCNLNINVLTPTDKPGFFSYKGDEVLTSASKPQTKPQYTCGPTVSALNCLEIKDCLIRKCVYNWP